MSLPPEKLQELKGIIHSHLDRMDIHSKVREFMSESARDKNDDTHYEPMDEVKLLRSIRDKGIIDDVMRGLDFKGLSGAAGQTKDVRSKEFQRKPKGDNCLAGGANLDKEFAVDPSKRYIYLQILGGKAFLEHLQDPEPLPGRATSTFTLFVQYREQRFKSRPVSCSCDPDFQEGFLIEVQKHPKDPGKISTAPLLLTVSDKVHLILIKNDLSGEKSLLSSHFLDWRRILSCSDGRSSFALEMNGVGAENNVPVGVLDIKLSIVPKISKKVTADVLSGQLNSEKSRLSERERLFLAYAKQWWREFLQIRASHSNRLVKIFAQDENGVHKLACSFVQPLRSGRLIDTPRQAARFVSLIGYDKASTIGGAHSEMWTNMLSFLCTGKGDVDNHSILLCSLLLGFGLNAFVCIGTKAKGKAHSWVASIGTDGNCVFWESLTGQRFVHQPINPDDPPAVRQPKPSHAYEKIGCAFNNKEFYANCQPSDNVDLCIFEFNNESLWKGMSLDAIKSVCGPGILPSPRQLITLLPPSVDPVIASNELEIDLRALVVEHRNNIGMTTQWDDELCYLLSPALAAYEHEHSLGVSVGNEEFQNAIRRNVPDGHTFKGFPIQFIHRNAARAFATCLRSPICEDIICCRGDQVRLAVRTRIFTYPEETMAVWIMFAVKYKSIL
ncbi:centrosomal protein of 76 kDa-like [Rhopilema esculentum]|uniref:centrosomal protein of 76 kDa-like n=1 Tax=Rhopilema esculentum TaxID=499914 RepID=UPI0031E2E8E2